MEKNKQVMEDGINKNILNIITPSGIDFGKSQVFMGENIGKIYAVGRYPSGVDYGWLAPFCNLSGTGTTIEFVSTEKANLISSYNARIRALKSNRDTVRDESERQNIEKAIEDITKMLHDININDMPVGYLNMMIFPQAQTQERLENRIKKINARVAGQGASLRILSFKQKQAFGCVAPYGIPNPVVSNIGNRNMTIATFMGGFPMAASGIRDNRGFYFGKTVDGRLVIMDIWLREGDRTNTNWFISGNPGVGKSSAVKDILLANWALGSRVYILDPEREYVDMAQNMGGEVIDCMGGRNGRINPLQIKPSPYEDDGEGDDLYADEGHGMGDMALHIQNLRTFFRLYKPELTDMQVSILERELVELYAAFDITWDTDISCISNEQFPLLGDLYAQMKKKAGAESLSEKQRTKYEDICSILYSMGEGADQFIWNSYTTMSPQGSFVVLDTSKLLEGDEGVKNAQSYNLLTWLWQQASINREEKVLAVVDEGYTLVDPDMPYAIKFLRNFSKRDRKYEAGLMFITHSAVDVLDPAVKRFGQAIIDNATYKLIMGCDGKNLKETTELFDLTEREERLLLGRQRGRGILFAGSTRVEVRIDISDSFLKLFGKGGGR